MNQDEFDKTERRPVTKRDFFDALRLLVKPVTTRSGRGDHKPSKAELDERYRLDRKPR